MEGSKRLFSDRELWALIIPLMGEMALKLVVGMIDTVMVASVGEAAVSGVSLVDSVIQLLIYIFAAMASGGAVVAGQYLGSGERKRARAAAGELVWLNGALGFGIMVMMFGGAGWILSALFGRITDEVWFHAQRYLTVVACSIPAIGVYEACGAIFRTMGNSKITMKLALVMNGMNCVGNGILIYGLGMGTRGAAIATSVSRWAAAVGILVLLLKPGRELSLERIWKHRFDGAMVRKIMAVGIPGGSENGLFQLGKIGILNLITRFGTVAIAANAVTGNLAAIQMIPGSAVQLAVVTILARCAGAGDYDQARYYNRKLLLFTHGWVAVVSGCLWLALPVVLSLYQLSGGTAELAREMFLWHTVGAVVLWPSAFILAASLRAAGDVHFTMGMSVFSMWVFRFGGAWLLAVGLGMGAAGAWVSMAVLDWLYRSVCYWIRWRGGKWEAKRVI